MNKLKDLDAVREQIRREVQLDDLATRKYGIKFTTTSTDDVKALCPFHSEDTPSFGVRRSTNLYHCFGCKSGGDLFKFVQEMEKIDHIAAIRTIAEFADLDLAQYSEPETEADRRERALLEVNDRVATLCENQKDDPVFKSWAKSRRLDDDVLATYRVGYSSGSLVGDLPDVEADTAKALELDWVTKWSSVVSVPIRDHLGRIRGYCNRLLGADHKVKVLWPKDPFPLEIPPLYGLYEARPHVRTAGFLILVEGEVDAWQMARHGFANVAATQGTKFNNKAVELLTSLSINTVVLMADNDEAGRKFAKSVARARIGGNLMIKIAVLKGNGKDPDEILLKDGPDVIQDAIDNAKYAFEYLLRETIQRHGAITPTSRLEILHEAKSLLATASPMEKELASRLLAQLIDTDYETIVDFFRDSGDTQTEELHNVHAEKVVLKRMLEDEEFVGEGLLALKSMDFFLLRHRNVFDTIGKLFRSQATVTPDSVRTTLENKSTGSEKNSASIVNQIVNAHLDTASASFLLQDLRDKAIRREVQKKAREAASRLSDTRFDARDTVQQLSHDLSSAVVHGGQQISSISDLVQERVAIMHERLKLPNAIIGMDIGSAFPVLNLTLHGLQRKRYVIISAPQGTGKTATAGQLAAIAAIDQQRPTLFLTFETGKDALTDRFIANLSGVESDKFLTGFLSNEEAKRVQEGAKIVASAPLMITERGIVFEEALSIIRHDVLRRKTQLVIVDYLQLMYMQNNKGMSQHQELGLISRGFLELSKELDITLIAVSQQNRDGAKAETNSAVNIGGAYKIAQDCDILIISREKSEDELKVDGPEKGNRIMTLAKHRHGKAPVTVNVIADLDVMRIREHIPRRAPIA